MKPSSDISLNAPRLLGLNVSDIALQYFKFSMILSHIIQMYILKV